LEPIETPRTIVGQNRPQIVILLYKK
jgi:hypothetical protein